MTTPQRLRKELNLLTFHFQRMQNVNLCKIYSPTRPNKTQYTAANIVKGIEANNAPNFPAEISSHMIKLEQDKMFIF